MIKTLQYHSAEERISLLQANINLILIEEKNIAEGNFLVFSDTPREPQPVYVTVPETEFTGVNQEINYLKERDTQMQEDISAIIESLVGGV